MADVDQVFDLLYSGLKSRHGRFTQDSPILPDVWVAFAGNHGQKCELLVSPHNRTRTADLAVELRAILPDTCRVVPNESHVLIEADIWQVLLLLMHTSWLLRIPEPLSGSVLFERAMQLAEHSLSSTRTASVERHQHAMLALQSQAEAASSASEAEAFRLARLFVLAASLVQRETSGAPETLALQPLRSVWERSRQVMSTQTSDSGTAQIWSISTNRRATLALTYSRSTIKADAAVRVFDVSARGIQWAVIDSGVDATHPALSRDAKVEGSTCDPARSRVVATLDFTRLRRLTMGDPTPDDRSDIAEVCKVALSEVDELVEKLRLALYDGRLIDWGTWVPFLTVPHRKGAYRQPRNGHGTHVAGILSACWRPEQYSIDAVPADIRDDPIIGVCPDLEIIDLRAFDGDTADEFSLIAALQYVRWLNQNKSKRVVHGVNLSFSLPHDVRNFACGRTPICEECERLWNSGVVVVAAAGNYGYHDAGPGTQGIYRTIGITDPGNTECCITVGSTHRLMPHAYGVSYFSSRGPTGDGRLKPDLVAPGEKIRSLGLKAEAHIQDGTSMAAPHVSGAAALLLARYPELIGQPDRVKNLLCATATDLGRDKSFQGAGLVDVLRAMQAM